MRPKEYAEFCGPKTWVDEDECLFWGGQIYRGSMMSDNTCAPKMSPVQTTESESDPLWPYAKLLIMWRFAYLLCLLAECWRAEFGIVLDEAPPEIGERNGACMPQWMGIGKPHVWREVVELKKHDQCSSKNNRPEFQPWWMPAYTSPNSPRQKLNGSHHHADFHVPSW